MICCSNNSSPVIPILYIFPELKKKYLVMISSFKRARIKRTILSYHEFKIKPNVEMSPLMMPMIKVLFSFITSPEKL